MEFPMWLSGNAHPTSILADVGSIRGPAQWVKEPVLLSCSIGCRWDSDFTPSQGTAICRRCGPKKKKKKKITSYLSEWLSEFPSWLSG